MSNAQIMIVEDEYIVAADLTNRLEELGFNVLYHATSGKEAIEKASELKPDMILMDIILRGEMDGIEAASRINDELKTPIIFVTAYTDEDKIARAKVTEPLGFLVKPFQDRELKTTMEMALYKARMNTRLRETEEKCLQLTESVNEVLILQDANDGSIIHVNRAYEALFGQPREMLYENPLSHLEKVHPEDKGFVLTAYSEGLLHDEFNSLEYRVIHNDGLKWVYSRSFPILDDDNRVYRRATVAEDITKRKTAEQALKESQELLSLAQEISRFGSFRWDIDTNEIQWSEQMYSILDIAPDTPMDALSEAAWNSIHPADIQEVRETASRLMRTRKPERMEFRIRTGKGDERYVRFEAHITTGANRRIEKVVGTIQDITESKRSEEALKASEEKYRTIVETANEGIWIINQSHRTAFVNRKMADMLGHKTEEMLWRPFSDFVQDDWKEFAAAVFGRRESNLKKEHDIKFITSDGREVWGLVSLTPLFSVEGIYTGALAMITDISERKNAEQTIKDNEARMRALYKGAPTPSFLWQRVGDDFLLIDFNSSAEKLTKSRIKDWIDIKASAFFMDSPDIIDDFKYCYEKKTTFQKQMQKRMITTGDDLELNVSYVYVPPDLVIVHLEDITERKRAEDEIRASEERFRTIADYTFDWEYWRGTDGAFNWVSPSCYRITGYTAQEFYDDRNLFFEIIHPEDRPVVETFLENDASSKKYYHLDFRIVRKDGEIRWISHNVQPIYDADGVWQGRRASNRDVTGRKDAEERLLSHQKQLRSLTTELSKAEERERRRIAVGLHDRVGHTLAMCQIKMNQLQMTVKENALQESLEDIVTLIESAISDTRSLTLEISPPSLYELGLEAALDELAQEIEDEHGIRCEVIDDGLPKPLSSDDRVILYRAARECMINVIKHAHSTRMRVTLETLKNKIVIEIADDGSGFDLAGLNTEEVKKHSFGLFSIRERMNHMGGKFKVESAPGEGTIVTLTAPLSNPVEIGLISYS